MKLAPEIAVFLVLGAASLACSPCSAESGGGGNQRPGVRLPVPFEAPGRGFVSLALYDEGGGLVRNLLYAKPVEKGPQVASWDATTDLGMPVAPGLYSARGIFFAEPPRLDFVMKVGKSGEPPFRTPDGKGDWGGNLGFPASICSNSKSLVMAWVCVEDNQITGIQQMDADGKIALRYFSFYPWDARMASAMDEDHYYLGILKSDEGIQVAEYTLGEPRGKILAKIPTTFHPTPSGRWKGRPTAYLDGMALTPGTIYASVAADDALFLIDRKSGDVRRRVEVASPHGLAVSGERLLVVSGKRVVSLNLDGGDESILVGDGVLEAPNALAVDAAGNAYVGDSGADFASDPERTGGHQQVFVFDRGGKAVRKIGKPGGSPRSGQFDPDGFGDITSLCLGPDGRTLFVQDVATGFCRTSRWSIDGAIQKQWFARHVGNGADAINPARPHELVIPEGFGSDTPGLTAYRIDLSSKTWRPSWHFEQRFDAMQQPPIFLGFEHGGSPFRQFQADSTLAKGWPVLDYGAIKFVTYRGRNYFMTGEGAFYTYDDREPPKLVALVYLHRGWKDGEKIACAYDQGPNSWFAWADRDGDGRIAADEATFTENPPMLEKSSRMASATLDDGLNLVLKRFVATAPGRAEIVDCILPLKEILPNGAPVYDWSLLKDAVRLKMPDLRGGDGRKTLAGISAGENLKVGDALYCLLEPQAEAAMKLPGIDGEGWWASRNWRKKLAKFDGATGRCLWAVGRRAPGRAEPGQMYNPISIAGEAGGAVFLADALSVVWAWDADGLYLGRLYNDTATGAMDANLLAIELQRSLIYTDPESGRIYSIADDTGACIHEVKLPKRDPIRGGEVAVSAEQASRVVPWDPDGAVPDARPLYRAMAVGSPPKIDGQLGEWSGLPDGTRVPEMMVMLDDQRIASVRALHDAENLYLAYSVNAPNGPLNSGSELPFAPFVSGAYVDFSVAPDWAKPQRDEVREGDLRVLMARIRGGVPKEAADFQRGFWQVKPGGESPQTITSPAARVHFDQIKPVPGLRVAYRVGEKDEKSGASPYEVEVAVPLASLGLTGEVAGRRIGFDASIGVANPPGDRRERAAHWAGQSEGVVVDRPGSARLLPETWGTLIFEPPGGH